MMMPRKKEIEKVAHEFYKGDEVTFENSPQEVELVIKK